MLNRTERTSLHVSDNDKNGISELPVLQFFKPQRFGSQFYVISWATEK